MLGRSTPAPAHEEEAEEPLAGDPVSGGGSPQSVDPSLGTTSPAGLSVWRRLRWVGLAFVPSSLMLGVTAFITTDITPIPLLWVIPLSLYLFSFVIVFSPSQRMPEVLHKLSVAALPLVMAALVVTVLTDLKNPYWALIGLNLFGFFVVAMVLHGEVARDRPPARHLPEVHLRGAVGGAARGVLGGGDGAARGGSARQAAGAAPHGVLPVGGGRRGTGRDLQRRYRADSLRYGSRVPAGDNPRLPVPARAGPLKPPR